jgi:hypothetical protein
MIINAGWYKRLQLPGPARRRWERVLTRVCSRASRRRPSYSRIDSHSLEIDSKLLPRYWHSPRIKTLPVGTQTPPEQDMFVVAPEEMTTSAIASTGENITGAINVAANNPKPVLGTIGPQFESRCMLKPARQNARSDYHQCCAANTSIRRTGQDESAKSSLKPVEVPNATISGNRVRYEEVN